MTGRRFGVMILTHGRADHVITYEVLRKGGYTGEVYIVIDNEDDSRAEYERKFENVVVFDKKAVAEKIDVMDNFEGRLAIVYARNVCYDLAGELKLTHFLQLDDDFSSMLWRWVEGRRFKSAECKNLDAVFDAMCDFLDTSGASAVTMAQGGDFIGGSRNKHAGDNLLRKAMNSFFCRTDRVINFKGRMNEDVNTYVGLGSTGQLFFTVTKLMVCQEGTQTNTGGMTSVYVESGTYTKSFYTVMMCPSSVKVALMGDKHKRMHHRVDWNSAVPKILSEEQKK